MKEVALFIWALVGLMAAFVVVGLLIRWIGPLLKKKGDGFCPPTKGADAPSGDGAATDKSSRSLSAARWLRSLVKADDDERTTRRGGS